MFRSAHAQNTSWKSALNDCLRQLIDNEDKNLGFVYVTNVIAPHLSSIVNILKKDTGIDQWIGSSSLGVCALSGLGAGEYFDSPAIAVMTATFPKEDYRIISTVNSAKPEEYDNIASDNDLANGPPLVLLHADCANKNVLEIIDDIALETGGYVIGGLTLSNTPKHHVANGISGGGVSGIIFNPEISVATALSQGCKPIGKIHEVTEATENFVVSLEGRKAFDVFNEEIGEHLTNDFEKFDESIHVALPVQGSDTGDYVVRNLLGVDSDEGIIAIAAPIEHGDRLMFVSRDSMLRRTILLKC